MRFSTILVLLVLFTELLATSGEDNWLDIKKQFQYEKITEQTAEVQFDLPQYKIENVLVNGENYKRINCSAQALTSKIGYPELPTFSGLFSISSTGVYKLENININTEEIISDYLAYPRQTFEREQRGNEFVRNEGFYDNPNIYPANIINISDPVILRDQRMINISINPFQYDSERQELRVIRKVSFDLKKIDSPGINRKTRKGKISRFFEPLYRSIMVNYEEINRNEDYQRPCYLFIYPDNNTVETDLAVLTTWKHKKGFEVHTASTLETGASLTSIKAYIQEAYDTWENPPEFVCLVGDAGGNFSIPTGHLDGGMYNGEGDHFYTMLEGDDILADVFIGRLSFNDILEFETIISKILNYEKNPYLGDLEWYNRALMLGDPTDSGPSTVTTNQSIVEMMSYEVPDIDCIEIYEGNWVNSISTNLNQGVLYFHYRGFANMSGWNNTNTLNLNNGYMLPVVTHITCVTGDFEGTYDCRSEAFLKAGSPSTPKGAIAAIGTATGNTHTCFNNIVSAGTFFGIFQDKIYNMGGALTRGKVALYNNYPTNPANHVHQFSYWNNLMGDPGMEVWTGIPQAMMVQYSSFVPLGANYLEVIVEDNLGDPLSNAWVTALRGEEEIFATGYTDEAGRIMLPVEAESLGEVNLTVTKHNFIPHLGSFEIEEYDVYVNHTEYLIDDDNSGFSIGNSDGLINPGEIIELNIELMNYGTVAANGVSLSVISNSECLNIIDPDSNYGTIQPQTTAYPQDPILLEISSNALGGSQLDIELSITDGTGNSWEDLLHLLVTGPYMYISSYQIWDGNLMLEPGETAQLSVILENIGLTQINGVEGVLTSPNNFIIVEDDYGFFGDIVAGGQSENSSDTYTITANSALINGSQVSFQIELINQEGFIQTLSFLLPVGEITESDPVGPDNYGYYCYDDSDTGYYCAPEYQWIEIDPAYGGVGTSLEMADYGNMGDIELVDLPIYFSFYGQIYEQITIASDGWICPGITEQTAFMNWQIPGPLGPSPMIAAFWDDLIIDQGNVYYYYNEQLHYFVVEWSRLNNEFNFAEETFEIVLFDANYYPTSNGDSDILVQYKNINNIDMGIYGSVLVQHGQYCTVGIENESGTVGLQYSFDDQYPPGARELENEMAILFTGPPINQEEPFLTISDLVIDDENQNGQVDYGETVNLYVQLNNLGNNPATGISAIITSSDEFTEILNNNSSYPDISGLNTELNEEPFSFMVSEECPNGHIIPLQLNVISNENNWELNFQINNNAPWIVYESMFVDDGINHILDPGEDTQVIFDFVNEGGSAAYNGVIEFSIEDQFINLNTETHSFSLLGSGETEQVFISFSISEQAPIGYNGYINWNLSADLGYQNSGMIPIYISQVPVELVEGFENFPPFGWTFDGGNNWLLSYSNFLGGEIPEVIFYWVSTQYTEQRLISPVLNTLGSTSLELQFRQLVYTENSDFELLIITSTDGMNWHPVASIPVQNTNPMLSSYTISNSDVGSPSFQFGFQAAGNTQGVIQWLIDDVILNEVETLPHGFIAGNINLAGGNGNVQEALVSTGEDYFAFPDENGDYVLAVQPGVYNVNASLGGYITEIAYGVEVYDFWETTFQDFLLSELTLDYCPQNLTAESSALDIILNWDIPGTYPERLDVRNKNDRDFSRTLLGYKIYREGELIGQNDNLNDTQFVDEMMDQGTYSYYVTALYGEGESQPSNVIEFEHNLPQPQNLTATITPNTIHILLNWQQPAGIEGLQVYYRIYCNNELIDQTYQLAYLHTNAPWGTLVYGVTAVYNDLFESEPAVITVEHNTANQENMIPLVTKLVGNYPNPFNPSTTISYHLSKNSKVQLAIYNIKGELIRILERKNKSAGIHRIYWDGRDENSKDVSCGIYFYRLETSDYSTSKKMIMMK